MNYRINRLDAEGVQAARQRRYAVAKPLHSPDKLEEMIVRIASIQEVITDQFLSGDLRLSRICVIKCSPVSIIGGVF